MKDDFAVVGYCLHFEVKTKFKIEHQTEIGSFVAYDGKEYVTELGQIIKDLDKQHPNSSIKLVSQSLVRLN